MEVERAAFVFSSEESTTVLNEFETVGFKKKVQVLGRACNSIVMWEASLDFIEVDAVLALLVLLTDIFQSYKEVVDTFSSCWRRRKQCYHG